MIPAWLNKIVAWLVGLIVRESAEQIKEAANAPDTIEKANTPPAVADKFADAYQQWLREKQSDSDKQQK
jgi:hypothetical protein